MDEFYGKECRRFGRDSYSRYWERYISVKENEVDYYKEFYKVGCGYKELRQ